MVRGQGFDAFRVSAQIQHCSSFTASWTGQAKSNIYERGQLIHFQVSAKTGPEQQLFIQSCFISALEEPHSRQRHAVVTNKGYDWCLPLVATT